ncbi:hypothetical protein [Williamsia sterculiae]|uniref:Diacylglycerol O-acyltransferase n=1 Tax=Williamsia sterculiae TaxID=1344003 RepID=A0A1N7DTX3_9NOCA|nr:hypothetical protein [Williamsia sterculiae]SIR79219.1 hypothetical protein SAMN05445060_0901 [Williamsia sterculiae]
MTTIAAGTARTGTAPRVTGADESYLLAQDLFGVSAPIQFLYDFHVDPGADAVAALRAALAQGSLHRAVSRTRVPGARHRWVRSDRAPAGSDDEVIADDEVGRWCDACLRGHRVDPIGGAGWRLDSAATEGGGRAVSLLVSHMVADGQAVYRALAEAAAGTGTALPAAASVGGIRGLRADVGDAIGQVGAAANSVRVLVREAVRNRRATSTGTAASSPTTGNDPARTFLPPMVGDEPEPTLLTVDVDATRWKQRAAEFDGTPNSLFTAVLSGVVGRSGLPISGELKVCVAVSRRDDESDDRANASGGVWIRLPKPIEPGADLGAVRAMSKRAFVDYAESGADAVADNLQPVVRLLPRRIVGRLMRSIAGPDVTVSNLGVAPRNSLRIGGRDAAGFGIRAIMQGTPAEQRRKQGPAVAAWAVQHGDTVTMTFFGIHPDHFGDVTVVRKLIDDELDAWGLARRFW